MDGSAKPNQADLAVKSVAPAAHRTTGVSPWLHRIAVVTALATLPLVFVGGAVTSKGAGLAVPDWPLSYGGLNPPNWWQIDHVRIEHGHRLLGASVGVLVILVVVTARLIKTQPAVRRFSYALLAAVCVQGLLGGLRVTEISTTLAVIHGVTAQLFFCMVVTMAVITGRRWQTQDMTISPHAPMVRVASVATFALLIVQLVLGAVQRHLGYGLLPHVLCAIVLAIVVGALSLRVVGDFSDNKLLARPAIGLALVIVVQLISGPAAWLITMGYDGNRSATLLEWIVPTLHVVGGALALACATGMLLAAYGRMQTPATQDASLMKSAGAVLT